MRSEKANPLATTNPYHLQRQVVTTPCFHAYHRKCMMGLIAADVATAQLLGEGEVLRPTLRCPYDRVPLPLEWQRACGYRLERKTRAEQFLAAFEIGDPGDSLDAMVNVLQQMFQFQDSGAGVVRAMMFMEIAKTKAGTFATGVFRQLYETVRGMGSGKSHIFRFRTILQTRQDLDKRFAIGGLVLSDAGVRMLRYTGISLLATPAGTAAFLQTVNDIFYPLTFEDVESDDDAEYKPSDIVPIPYVAVLAELFATIDASEETRNPLTRCARYLTRYLLNMSLEDLPSAAEIPAILRVLLRQVVDRRLWSGERVNEFANEVLAVHRASSTLLALLAEFAPQLYDAARESVALHEETLEDVRQRQTYFKRKVLKLFMQSESADFGGLLPVLDAFLIGLPLFDGTDIVESWSLEISGKRVFVASSKHAHEKAMVLSARVKNTASHVKFIVEYEIVSALLEEDLDGFTRAADKYAGLYGEKALHAFLDDKSGESDEPFLEDMVYTRVLGQGPVSDKTFLFWQSVPHVDPVMKVHFMYQVLVKAAPRDGATALCVTLLQKFFTEPSRLGSVKAMIETLNKVQEFDAAVPDSISKSFFFEDGTDFNAMKALAALAVKEGVEMPKLKLYASDSKERVDVLEQRATAREESTRLLLDEPERYLADYDYYSFSTLPPTDSGWLSWRGHESELAELYKDFIQKSKDAALEMKRDLARAIRKDIQAIQTYLKSIGESTEDFDEAYDMSFDLFYEEELDGGAMASCPKNVFSYLLGLDTGLTWDKKAFSRIIENTDLVTRKMIRSRAKTLTCGY